MGDKITVHVDKFPEEGEPIEIPVICNNCDKPQMIERTYYFPMVITYGECCCGAILNDENNNYTELNVKATGKIRNMKIQST